MLLDRVYCQGSSPLRARSLLSCLLLHWPCWILRSNPCMFYAKGRFASSGGIGAASCVVHGVFSRQLLRNGQVCVCRLGISGVYLSRDRHVIASVKMLSTIYPQGQMALGRGRASRSTTYTPADPYSGVVPWRAGNRSVPKRYCPTHRADRAAFAPSTSNRSDLLLYSLVSAARSGGRRLGS